MLLSRSHLQLSILKCSLRSWMSLAVLGLAHLRYMWMSCRWFTNDHHNYKAQPLQSPVCMQLCLFSSS